MKKIAQKLLKIAAATRAIFFVTATFASLSAFTVNAQSISGALGSAAKTEAKDAATDAAASAAENAVGGTTSVGEATTAATGAAGVSTDSVGGVGTTGSVAGAASAVTGSSTTSSAVTSGMMGGSSLVEYCGGSGADQGCEGHHGQLSVALAGTVNLTQTDLS